MSVSDTYLTQNIAKERVDIERRIGKVKTYEINISYNSYSIVQGN